MSYFYSRIGTVCKDVFPRVDPYPKPSAVPGSTPVYYRFKTSDGHEVHLMDVIDGFSLNFNRGCILKYVSRAGKKDPTKELQDLKKARDCLEQEIRRVEATQAAQEKK